MRTIIPLLVSILLSGCVPSCGPEEQTPSPDDATNNQPAPDAGKIDVGIADDFEVARSSLQRATPNVSDEALQQFARANANFAIALYDQIAEPGENLFYSPYSISAALAMTYAGANGQTETQMKQAMRFELDEPQLHEAFNALDRALEGRGDNLAEGETGEPFTLEIANSIWGQTGFPFVQGFLDTLAQHYGAGMRLLDFVADAEQARQIINAWVEMITRDRIKDLIPQGVITAATRLVLTNAIYFKASWKTKFDESATAQGPFTKLDGTTVQTDLMHLEDKGFARASGDGWTAAELPYVGDDVSMVVIVPDDFDAYEGALTGEQLIAVFDSLSPQALTLTMPKFEFEAEFNLNDALKALGMTDAFDASADFTGMHEPGGLFIQAVVHKAFVAVDEEGTEAAAATAVIVGETSVPEFVEFKADRPFLFFIRDRPTNSVLFAGRVLQP